MNLASIKSSRVELPLKVVVYGSIKVGKSTFGAGAPSPVFIATEEGLAALDVPSFPVARSLADVMEAIEALGTEDHEFQTVVVDSLDWLEPIIWSAVSKAAGVTDIEKVGGGFGKGYVEASRVWRDFLDALDWLRKEKGMGIILICHDEVRRHEPPDGDAFDMASLKLHKRASALVSEWADVIGFAHAKRHVKKSDSGGFNKTHSTATPTGRRVLHVGQHPAYQTGNRYGMVDEVGLSWQDFSAALDAARSAR